MEIVDDFSQWVSITSVLCRKKVFFNTNNVWKLPRAFGTDPDPFISDNLCCYSQSRFDEAAKLFHKLGKGGGPDQGSFPVASMNVYGLAHLA